MVPLSLIWSKSIPDEYMLQGGLQGVFEGDFKGDFKGISGGTLTVTVPGIVRELKMSQSPEGARFSLDMALIKTNLYFS